MKKVIICLLTVLLLCGCSKKIDWDEAKESFSQIDNEINSIVSNIDTIKAADYKSLIDELNGYISDIEFSQKEDNLNLLNKTYKAAKYLEAFASLFDGNCAKQLLALAVDGKELVKSIYDNNEEGFETIKNEIQTKISEISSWADSEWSSVEKEVLISWDDVAEQYDEIEIQAKDEMLKYEDVVETDLEELKHIIIDNYDEIKNGITDETDELARQMYAAAVQLQAYTKYIKGKEVDKVYYFAKDTISFIKQCYGKTLTEEEAMKQDYKDDIASARKWTQSTWNEITRELKLYTMPER